MLVIELNSQTLVSQHQKNLKYDPKIHSNVVKPTLKPRLKSTKTCHYWGTSEILFPSIAIDSDNFL